jgi:CHASE2 domain-containing sensor protein
MFKHLNKIKPVISNPFWMGTVVSVFLLFFVLLNVFNISEQGRNVSLDLMTKLYPFEKLYPENTKQLVFVNIDDASIAEFGQWPWPRQLTAKLVNKVAEKKPAAIGLDILITEKDRFAPDNIAKTLNLPLSALTSVGAQDGDVLLGKSVTLNPVVTAFALSNENNKTKTKFNNRFVTVGEVQDALPLIHSLLLPIEPLLHAAGNGFVNTYKSEGIIRESPMVAKSQDLILPSLSLDLLRVALGAKNHMIKLDNTTQSILIKTGEISTELSDSGNIIFHHGHLNRFEKISAANILKNQNEKIEGKIVIIGSAAAGLGDLHSTSLEDDMPGPLFHLQIIDQILAHRFIQYHIAFDRLIFVLCTALSILFSFLIVRTKLHYTLIALPIVVISMMGITIYSFLSTGLIFNAPIALGLLLTGNVVTYGSLIGQRFVTHRAVEKDIKEATIIQSHLFPKRDLFKNIAGGVLPYKSLSGDFIDYIKIENKIAFIEGDVSGKGLPAALLMARSIALFRLFARRKLAADIIARGINDEIYSHGTADKFVTSVIGWYDLEDHKISFVNCGHNPVLLVNKNQHQAFDTSSPPFGVIAKDEFLPHLNEITLDEESVMYIATDGITEGLIKVSKNKTIELGTVGLVKFAQKNLAIDAIDQVEKLLNLIKTQKMVVNDDSTILVISRPNAKVHE